MVGLDFYKSKDIISAVTVEKTHISKDFKHSWHTEHKLLWALNTRNIWFTLPRVVCRCLNSFCTLKKNTRGSRTTVSSVIYWHLISSQHGYGISWTYSKHCGLPKILSPMSCAPLIYLKFCTKKIII